MKEKEESNTDNENNDLPIKMKAPKRGEYENQKEEDDEDDQAQGLGAKKTITTNKRMTMKSNGTQNPFEKMNGLSQYDQEKQLELEAEECQPWFTLQTQEDETLECPGLFKANFKTYTYARISTIFWLSNQNSFRKYCVRISTHKYFDNFFMAVILMNVLVLAIYDYKDREDKTERNKGLQSLSNAFTICYGIEAIFKIVSQGFIWGSNSYMRNGWNLLDSAIVFFGVIEWIYPHSSEMRNLKVLRAMRPLKGINQVPQLKRLVNTLITSLPALGSVLLFMTFFIFIFATAGVHLFMGDYYARCRMTPFPRNATYWEIDQSQPRSCDIENGQYQCNRGTYCGHLREYQIDLNYDEVITNFQIQYGIATFDDFWMASLAVIQIITFDNWTVVMRFLVDSSDKWIGGFFCIIIVILCSFFLLNLVLAVIMQSFSILHKKDTFHKLDEEREILVERIRKKKKDHEKRMKRLAEGSFREEKSGSKGFFSTFHKKKDSQSIEASLMGSQKTKKDPKGPNLNGSINKVQPFQPSSALVRNNVNAGIRRQNSKFLKGNTKSKFNKTMKAGDDVSRQNSYRSKFSKKSKSTNSQKTKKSFDKSRKSRSSLGGSNSQSKSRGGLTSLISMKTKKSGNSGSKMNMYEWEATYQKAYAQMMIEKRRNELQKLKDKKAKIRFMIDERADQNKIFEVFADIQDSSYFKAIIIIVVNLHSLLLLTERYGVGQKEIKLKNYLYFGFAIFYGLELLIKLLGLGIRIYVKDKNNILAALVAASLLTEEFLFKYSSIKISEQNIGLLRILAITRLVSIADQFTNLRVLLGQIKRTLKDIGSFTVLLVIMIVTYALMGQELFAWKVKFDEYNLPISDPLNAEKEGDWPLVTFNTINEALFSVFVVFANDEWINILVEHYKSTSGIQTVPFFMSLLMLGQYVLLNLFLAILLENFDDDNLEEQNKKANLKQASMKSQPKHIRVWHKIKDWLIADKYNNKNKLNKKKKSGQKVNLYEESMPSERSFKFNPKKRTLNMFREGDAVQNTCFWITNHQLFNYTITLAIIVQIIDLSLMNPLMDPNSTRTKVLEVIDQILTYIFAAEAVLKIIATGLIKNGKFSYLRNNWNVLDFVIVVASLLPIILKETKFFQDYGKLLGTFKVLRPFRIVNKSEGLKVSLVSLFKSITGVSQVLQFALLFYFILSVIAINYFKGSFYNCESDHISTDDFVSFDPKTKWECISLGANWVNRDQNFDNIFMSMLTIFIMMTTSGWMYVMYDGIYSTKADHAPERNEKIYFGYFFIAIMIITSFFIQKLFIGVVVSTYNNVKELQSKDYLLTQNQKNWLRVKLMVFQSNPIKRPTEPKGRLAGMRMYFFRIANSQGLEWILNFCIIVRSVLMTFFWYDMPPTISGFVAVFLNGFKFLFIAEAVVKIIGNGKKYFQDIWNQFDFTLVCMSLTNEVLTRVNPVEYAKVIEIFNMLRIVRIFKVIRRFKSLRIIFQTFFMSLSAMLNLGGLLLLFMYVFAILGVELFSNVKIQLPLNDVFNFQTVLNAMLVLLQTITGDNWHEVYFATQKGLSVDNFCLANPDYGDYKKAGNESIGCGNAYITFFYFFFFISLCTLTLLNLFIAIILMGYEETRAMLMNDYNIDIQEEFQEQWSKHDPDAEGTILITKVGKILTDIGPPLGWEPRFKRNPELRDEFFKMIKFNPHGHGLYVEYYDVLEKLALHLTSQQQVRQKHKDDEVPITHFQSKKAQAMLANNKIAIRQAEIKTASLTSRNIRLIQSKKKKPIQVTLGNAFMLRLIHNYKFREAIGRKSHPPTYNETRKKGIFERTISQLRYGIGKQLADIIVRGSKAQRLETGAVTSEKQPTEKISETSRAVSFVGEPTNRLRMALFGISRGKKSDPKDQEEEKKEEELELPEKTVLDENNADSREVNKDVSHIDSSKHVMISEFGTKSKDCLMPLQGGVQHMKLKRSVTRGPILKTSANYKKQKTLFSKLSKVDRRKQQEEYNFVIEPLDQKNFQFGEQKEEKLEELQESKREMLNSLSSNSFKMDEHSDPERKEEKGEKTEEKTDEKKKEEVMQAAPKEGKKEPRPLTKQDIIDFWNMKGSIFNSESDEYFYDNKQEPQKPEI